MFLFRIIFIEYIAKDHIKIRNGYDLNLLYAIKYLNDAKITANRMAIYIFLKRHRKTLSHGLIGDYIKYLISVGYSETKPGKSPHSFHITQSGRDAINELETALQTAQPRHNKLIPAVILDNI